MLPPLDYKKIILAILILVVGISLIIGIFWLVFLRSSQPTGSDEAWEDGVGGNLPATGEMGEGQITGQSGNLPIGDRTDAVDGQTRVDEVERADSFDEKARGSFTIVNALSTEPSKGITRVQQGLNFLSLEDNKFYRLTDGSEEKILLADKVFPNVDDVVWSPDGKKVFLEYPDGANVVYDFNKGKQTTFPTGAEDLSWENGSDVVAYKYIGDNEDANWLVVSSADGKDATPVEPLGSQGYGVQVEWSPTSQVVALYHKAIGINREEVFFIGLNDDNFKSLVVEGSNFEGRWSPSGDRILYHVTSDNNNYNPVLWATDAAIGSIGNNNFNLGLTTWVDKCIFANNNTVYCAVPISLPEGSGMFPQELNDSGDVFYKIDLATGLSKMIAYPVLSSQLDKFQVDNLFITEDGTKLFFLDVFTNLVYFLQL
jgi:hypothetical protein